MTYKEFIDFAYEIGKQAGAIGTHHNYFLVHAQRLYKTHIVFNLFNRKLGDALEIGPLYSYTPFILFDRANSFSVLEGDEAGVYPLLQLYKRKNIDVRTIDLGAIFGDPKNPDRRLPYTDSQFDSIICWETMEHFNFNPVPFVLELYRICKKGASVFITVPNRASAEAILNLLTGRGQNELIDEFYKYANYEVENKKTFFGFHWREYTAKELRYLFERAAFRINNLGCLTEFQEKKGLSISRKTIRTITKLITGIIPSLGNHIYLECQKP